MSANSKISWTDATWNPVVGCSPVSPGCAQCYAVRDAARMAGNPNRKIHDVYVGLTSQPLHGPSRWTGVVRCLHDRLEIPLRWKKPRRVFVNSMSDLFHPDVPDQFLDSVFAVVRKCYQHQFQILTKRPERMRAYLSNRLWPSLTPNTWVGVSCENQETADERIPQLLQTPVALGNLFVSCEPLLGPIQFGYGTMLKIRWVIVGGESGPSARPCNVEWIRDIVLQCRRHGAACSVKQLGTHPVGCYLSDRKGGDPAEWPEDLRVREMPLSLKRMTP